MEKTKVPLSQRIRPDCEAAPWVIEEVMQLENKISSLLHQQDIALSFHKIAIKDRDLERLRVDTLQAEIERLQDILPPTAHAGVRNGPTEGTWSVYAGKVAEERDAALAEVKRLRDELIETAGWLDGLADATGLVVPAEIFERWRNTDHACGRAEAAMTNTRAELTKAKAGTDAAAVEACRVVTTEDAAMTNEPPEPIYQHTADELRWVADLLDVLNRKTVGTSVGFDGELEVYWCDRRMGCVSLDDPEDLSSWCYFPAANQLFE
jgi:hypothetical protein